MNLPTSPGTVFLYAMITAVATGLGVLPLMFFRRPSGRVVATAEALAAGLMAGASWGLVVEGANLGIWRTLAGVALGILVIRLSHDWLEGRDVKWGTLDSGDAKKVLMMLGVMTAHSFSEGVGVGVSFGGGETLGVFITLAIAVHNIPEGLAIALTMVPRGTSIRKAGVWSVVSSLPQPLMAVPAFIFVALFTPFLPVGLGFAAGAMGWMIAREMLPEAIEVLPAWRAVGVAAVSGLAMIWVQTLL